MKESYIISGPGGFYFSGFHILTHYENLPMQYTKILSALKMISCEWGKNDIFNIFTQNIDCGFTARRS